MFIRDQMFQRIDVDSTYKLFSMPWCEWAWSISDSYMCDTSAYVGMQYLLFLGA